MSMILTVRLLVENLQKLVEEPNQIKQGMGKLVQIESLKASIIFKLNVLWTNTCIQT